MTRRSGTFRKLVCFAICIASLAFAGVDRLHAQSIERVEISSAMNPVGSGARAMGMGGAFIAVADDATAASWNPGGLIQLEQPEVSIVGAFFQRTEDNTFSQHSEASGAQDTSQTAVNYLSAAYPFSLLNRNMIVSINYQNLYGLYRNWNYSSNIETNSFEEDRQIDIEQEGGLYAWGLAYAMQITPNLSCGLTLNFWEDGLYSNGWELAATQRGSGTQEDYQFQTYVKSREKYTLRGFNFNLGVLWHVNGELTVGAVFKSPFTADVTYSSSYESETRSPDNPSADKIYSDFDKGDEELDMPMSYGIGLAYRFSDHLTASGDIYRTEWGDYVYTDYNGKKISPITGEPASESDIPPTTQLRIGLEYLWLSNRLVIPLRGGLFYDPLPAEDRPDAVYGFSLGSGIASGRFVFDLAYQYRIGNDVGKSLVLDYDFSQDLREHTVYASMIVHF